MFLHMTFPMPSIVNSIAALFPVSSVEENSFSSIKLFLTVNRSHRRAIQREEVLFELLLQNFPLFGSRNHFIYNFACHDNFLKIAVFSAEL